MSKGGFTGKGVFGSLPYLVVEYDNGKQKQCNFKHEEDVDCLLTYVETPFPVKPPLLMAILLKILVTESMDT